MWGLLLSASYSLHWWLETLKPFLSDLHAQFPNYSIHGFDVIVKVKPRGPDPLTPYCIFLQLWGIAFIQVHKKWKTVGSLEGGTSQIWELYQTPISHIFQGIEPYLWPQYPMVHNFWGSGPQPETFSADLEKAIRKISKNWGGQKYQKIRELRFGTFTSV